jgi:hypothetical protein
VREGTYSENLGIKDLRRMRAAVELRVAYEEDGEDGDEYEDRRDGVEDESGQ